MSLISYEKHLFTDKNNNLFINDILLLLNANSFGGLVIILNSLLTDNN
jgi:hypothetical protein